LIADLNTWSGVAMPELTARALRREAFQRAIYSRFNSHPETQGKISIYSDAWLLAGHAVDAILDVEEMIGSTAPPVSPAPRQR
jgi:hypothetical protein